MSADGHLSQDEVSLTRLGLRSYDIAIGFRNLYDGSAVLSEYKHTHVTGMAAVLAGAIKGRDIISDARSLRAVAADILKINHWAFEGVVRELAELELVRDVRYQGEDVISFSEQVPLFYDGLHERLGAHWLAKGPTELEQQLMYGVDLLARAPVLAADFQSLLGTDKRTEERLRMVGERAELIRYLPLQDGSEIAVTPLYAFERPDALIELFERDAPERVAEAFARIRAQPGFPLEFGKSDPVVEEMVRAGLVQAPTVVGADGRQRAFIVIPYALNADYLTTKKSILDRALALIACVRCGEISGGVTSIRFPDRLLACLIDPNRNYMLVAHSSAQRQYAPLLRIGMIKMIPGDGRVGIQLIPTNDNLEAVELARTLLQRRGEGVPARGNEQEAANLLFTGREYLAPLETIHAARKPTLNFTQTEVQDLWGRAAGWTW